MWWCVPSWRLWPLWSHASIAGCKLLVQALCSTSVQLQTKGLKSGSTIVVCTMAAVASVVTGVLAGLLALGEAMPSSPGACTHFQALRLIFIILHALDCTGSEGPLFAHHHNFQAGILCSNSQACNSCDGCPGQPFVWA